MATDKNLFSDDFSKRNHFIDFIKLNSLERRNQTKPSFSTKKWGHGEFCYLEAF